MRIALLCEESAGLRLLDRLARGAHALVAVLTTEGSPAWNLAARLGLRPAPARRVREPGFAAWLAGAGCELILNVHSLHIVPGAVLEVPRLGAYNLHPGPLPRYAGLNAPSWALYFGETKHGVTLHRMEPGIDTGPVVFQEEFPVEETDTGLSLALRCAQKGLGLVDRLLELLARGEAPALKMQNLQERRYFGRAGPQGGRIDWTLPARRIHDFVRACDYRPFASPWGTPLARLENREIRVFKTALTGERCAAAPGTLKGETLVATADEWLRLESLKALPAEDEIRQEEHHLR